MEDDENVLDIYVGGGISMSAVMKEIKEKWGNISLDEVSLETCKERHENWLRLEKC